MEVGLERGEGEGFVRGEGGGEIDWWGDGCHDWPEHEGSDLVSAGSRMVLRTTGRRGRSEGSERSIDARTQKSPNSTWLSF